MAILPVATATRIVIEVCGAGWAALRNARSLVEEKSPSTWQWLGARVAYHCEAGVMGSPGTVVEIELDKRENPTGRVRVQWDDTGYEEQWYSRPGEYSCLQLFEDEWEVE